MGKQDRLPTPVVAVVGLTVWLLLAVPILIVMILAEAGRRTVQATHRTVRRIHAAIDAHRELLIIVAMIGAGGLVVFTAGCSGPTRTFETRIDDYGNITMLDCVGECLFLEFDEIFPASAE